VLQLTPRTPLKFNSFFGSTSEKNYFYSQILRAQFAVTFNFRIITSKEQSVVGEINEYNVRDKSVTSFVAKTIKLILEKT
jgi:hypothetical protein